MLGGSIPSQIGLLTALQHLYVAVDRFGCCGLSVDAIVSSQVHYNSLVGSLPKAVGMLTQLRSLCVAIILRPRVLSLLTPPRADLFETIN
jgi:hypothetical protein